MNIDRVFKYHPPTGNQPQRYTEIREMAKQFAKLIDQWCPDSREKSTALTNLQQCVMWANASIAINEEKSHVD